ncbi:family 20 glycosylhydrolase [Sphingobacterium hungaricum]|uniref:beta-N-acetylhexosaminidase n=1 Tax=Sphingobacterium hungaricum TaxID=2082723 RepID=A0A928YQC6_9SPHI|nr:family 20 glycosylhydrolase [Sphingobacterium hungaricum]MBE8713819.1 beta-N-acetylhexosaminidase [Sphingobacterium hungaricum]
MKKFNLFFRTALCGFICLLVANLAHAQQLSDQIHIHWRPAQTYAVDNQYSLQLILKNNSNQVANLQNFDLWFNSIFPIVDEKHTGYELTDENGNLFKVKFLQNQTLQPQDSIVIDFKSKYKMANASSIVNGFYFQNAKNPNQYFPVKNFHFVPITVPPVENKQFLAAVYDRNAEIKQASSLLLLPTPASLRKGKGQLEISQQITYSIDPSFPDALQSLQDFVFNQPGFSFAPAEKGKATIQIIKNAQLEKEAYSLDISQKAITIEASTDAGVFYALQSINSLIKVADQKADPSKIILPAVKIDDKPRFGYRGLMLDIARNFKDTKTIKKYIDIMAMYKLNTLHLHFIDDEGWRIEIPSLPELTEIGANRSPSFADGKSIQPAYGSGGVSSEKAFLSQADFIDLLQYAQKRHIEIIPEIETPGHARASIKAMETRYNRLMELGKPKEANQYLLHDFEDQSIYNSAQNWDDNVMNVALPSVYTFISTVIDDLKAMYVKAGLTMKTVSIGGDEVPNGVWEKSPKIKQLMDSLNFSSVNQVWPYYVAKVYDLANKKGVNIAGWEEIGMVNQGNGMVVNKELASTTMQLDVWNNVVGGGQEDLAYRLANAGYKTVFISSSNFYFDMAWNNRFDEPGLVWASLIDLYQAYSFLPESFFANINLYAKGKAFDKKHFNSSIRLNEKGRSNLIGVKGGLWSETILDEQRMDYMAFPRFFALAERAWSPVRSWESEVSFSKAKIDKEYGEFINRVGQEELPKLDLGFEGINYRLPGIGVKLINSKLCANLEYPGFDIYYSTDGSTPTKSSSKYSEPIVYDPSTTYTFLVIHENGRAGNAQVYSN